MDEKDFNKMLSLYYGCVNDFFKYHPEYRPGRCLLGFDEAGFPILCSKRNACKDCPRKAENLPRYKSLEDFIQFVYFEDTHEDEDGNTVSLEVPDPHSNPEEDAMLEILFAELVEYLGKASSRYAKIATLGKQKLSKEEIIAELGLKSSRGYQEIDKAKKLAEKFLYEL